MLLPYDAFKTEVGSTVVRSNYSIFGRGPNQLRESGRLDVKVTKKSIRRFVFCCVFASVFFFFSPLWNVWSWFCQRTSILYLYNFFGFASLQFCWEQVLLESDRGHCLKFIFFCLCWIFIYLFFYIGEFISFSFLSFACFIFWIVIYCQIRG